MQNTVPHGEFFVGFAIFEEWAGNDFEFNSKGIFEDTRILVRGTYNFRSNWFMGVYANGGKGPDDVAVFFGIKKTTNELLKFIGL